MRRWLTAVLFCAAGVIAPAAVAAPVSANTDTLRLISQAFNVTATGSVTMTVQLPPALAGGGTDFSVSITAYRPIVGRDAVTAAIASTSQAVATVDMHSTPATTPMSDNPLLDAERAAILHAVEQCRWNMTLTARQLGMSRNTLYRKLKRHDIAVGDSRRD